MYFASLPLKRLKEAFRAREELEHRLLGPLSSELRSEVTSEATDSLRGHLQRKSHGSGRNSQLRTASSFLLHSLVVKASDFGAIDHRFKSDLNLFPILLNFFQTLISLS